MSCSVSTALFIIASGISQAPVIMEDSAYSNEYTQSKAANYVILSLAEFAAAAAVYKWSDDELGYYPLTGYASNDNLNLKSMLSTQYGGYSFELSTISQSHNEIQHFAPSYRESSRKMANILPGYPQPAQLIVGLKIRY